MNEIVKKSESLGNVVVEGSKAITTASASSIVLKKNVGSYVLFGWLVLLVMFVGFFYWASTYKLDKANVALGKVEVASKNKQVEHIDGGRVKKILVKDGQDVVEGQTLFYLEDAEYLSRLQSIQKQIWETKASIVRLRAEKDGEEELSWLGSGLEDEDVPEDILSGQEELFRFRQKSLDSKKNALTDRGQQSENQISSLEERIKGLYAQIDVENQRIKGQQQRIKGQQQQIEGIKADIAKKQSEIKGQQGLERGQQEQVAGLHEDIKRQNQQIQILQDRIRSLQQQRNGPGKQIGALQKQIQSLNVQISREAELVKRKLKIDVELRQLERQREQLQANIYGRQSEIQRMDAEIKKSHQEINQAKTSIARIQRDINRINSDRSNLSEKEGINAEIRKLYANIEQIQAGIGGIHAEIGGIHSGIEKHEADIAGLHREIERIRKGMSEIGHQMDGQEQDYKVQVSSELSRLREKLPQLLDQKKQVEEKLSRVEVVSPATGRIKGFEVSTKGAVISSGNLIMEIVPDDNNFIIIANLDRQDRDTVTLGRESRIQFSVFDQSMYLKDMNATLKNVATDTQIDKVTGQEYYKITLELTNETIAYLAEEKLALVSGMPVEVFVNIGEQTLLAYLLKPMERIFAASLSET